MAFEHASSLKCVDQSLRQQMGSVIYAQDIYTKTGIWHIYEDTELKIISTCEANFLKWIVCYFADEQK